MIFFATARMGFAQPAGSITVQVADVKNVIWDLSMITDTQNVDLDIRKVSHAKTNGTAASFFAPSAQDGRGKLFGEGATLVTLVPDETEPATNTFTAHYTSRGSLSSSKGIARLALSIKASGHTLLGDNWHVTRDRDVTAQGNYSMVLDANTGQMHGRCSAKVTAAGLGSIADSVGLGPEALAPELGDGSWSLVLNFADLAGNKLSGLASVTLKTGQVYRFRFRGTYLPHTGVSKLSLTGYDTGTGSVLQVTLKDGQVSRVNGRVSGQSVDFTP